MGNTSAPPTGFNGPPRLAGDTLVAISIVEADDHCAPPAKTFGVVAGEPRVVQHGQQPSRGTIRRLELTGLPTRALEELADVLRSMPSRQAIACAPPPAGRDVWRFTTKRDLATLGAEAPADAIARTADFLKVPGGLALIGLDVDAKGWPSELRDKVQTNGGLSKVLATVAPAFRGAACLLRASSSAGVRVGDSGPPTSAEAGQHRFLIAADGADAGRFIDALCARLVLAGYGFAFVSQAGHVEVRTLVDRAATGELSRLWFEGAAILGDRELQFAPGVRDPKVVSGGLLDTYAVLDLDGTEADQFVAIEAGIRRAAEPHARAVRERWREKRIAELVAAGKSRERAAKLVGALSETHVLLAEHELTFDDGSTATVREIMDHPKAFHRATMPDPLEPEYGRGENLAIIYTDCTPPRIHSQAHGGIVYTFDLASVFFETEEDRTEAAQAAPAERFEPLFPEGPAEPDERFTFTMFEEAAATALASSARPLIKGLLDQGAMSVLYGESNSGKTFVAMDISHHVAAGVTWNGLRTTRASVVYVAAEGGQGARKRAAALKAKSKGADVDGFRFLLHSVNLLRADADLGPLIAGLRRIGPVGLVVIDTFSRAMAGGDENASTDMGAMVRHLDAIRAATGAHLMVVHHTGKDKAKGARGHTLLRAATDTEIEIDDLRLTVTKQRDLDKSFAAAFSLEVVTLGVDGEGDPITSCTVRWTAAASPTPKRSAANDQNQKIAAAVLDVLGLDRTGVLGDLWNEIGKKLADASICKATSRNRITDLVKITLAGHGVCVERGGQTVIVRVRQDGIGRTAPWIVEAEERTSCPNNPAASSSEELHELHRGSVFG
ncbi:AAA family ATPase [Methylopila sp. 73B]|uniref:AAA family ATPase n=1 Tax=Methylopila sp. 73B TaxID=1120792 RepID=UPI0003AA9E49|nr:AAA family ATPase [Methylopila sp. 73B]